MFDKISGFPRLCNFSHKKVLRKKSTKLIEQKLNHIANISICLKSIILKENKFCIHTFVYFYVETKNGMYYYYLFTYQCLYIMDNTI